MRRCDLLGSCLASKADKRPAGAGVLAEGLARLSKPAPPPPKPESSPRPIWMLPPLVPPPPPVVSPRPKPIARPSRSLPKQITNIVGMKFVLVPAGPFVMGSPTDETGRTADEGPQHEVTITRPFYLSIYPVTQMQYQLIVRGNPSHFSRSGRGKEQVKDVEPKDLPVERVTWGNAIVFCRKLSERPEERQQGRVYRLPTEAEWEYACRGNSIQPFHLGLALSSTLANFDGNYPYGGAPRGAISSGQRRSDRIRPTALACTICMATSGSGAKTGMASSIIKRVRRKIHWGRRQAIVACCAADVGAVPAATAAPPTAASSNRATMCIASASGSCWRHSPRQAGAIESPRPHKESHALVGRTDVAQAIELVLLDQFE